MQKRIKLGHIDVIIQETVYDRLFGGITTEEINVFIVDTVYQLLLEAGGQCHENRINVYISADDRIHIRHPVRGEIIGKIKLPW